MHGIKHPFSGAIYEQDGNGNILVTHKGKTGLFKRNGAHISGEVEEADPQLCGWVGGPMIANHRVTSSAKADAT